MTDKTQKRKLSYRLAQQIARDIIEDGWVEGRPIGREPELLKKYCVSRDTFREAVRILELQGIAKSSKGPGGGLRVAAPADEAIINILRDYLELTDITFEEVLECSRIVDGLVVGLATKRLTEQGIEELQRLVDERRVLHGSRKEEIRHLFKVYSAIGRQTENPALALFMEPLHYILIDYSDVDMASEEEFLEGGRKGWAILNRIVQAIIAGDDSSAQRFMNDYIDLIAERSPHMHRGRRKSGKGKKKGKKSAVIKPLWFKESNYKRAQSLIYEIKRDISDAGLEIGDRLGREAELVKQYGVSRSVFRESVRLMEMMGIAQLRKGRDGGLMVSSPDPSGTVAAAVLFLEYEEFQFDQINEARTALDEAAAQLAAERLDDVGEARLREALEAEMSANGENFIEKATDVAQAVSELSGNRALSLFIKVLVNSSVFKPVDQLRMEKATKNAEKIKQSHRKVVEAILDRNTALSRRRMTEHRDLAANVLRI